MNTPTNIPAAVCRMMRRCTIARVMAENAYDRAAAAARTMEGEEGADDARAAALIASDAAIMARDAELNVEFAALQGDNRAARTFVRHAIIAERMARAA